MRLVIITSMPSPYRIPLFNALNTECINRGWRLKILFMTRTYKRRQWNVAENEFEFDYVYLNDYKFVSGETMFSFSFSVFHRLVAENPDMIVVGGFSAPAVWTNIYCRLFEKRYFIWSGETVEQNTMRKRFRYIREMVRTFLMAYAQGFVVYGSAAKKYLLDKNISEEKIFVAINTVDSGFYMTESSRARLQRNELIKKHAIPDGKNIIYVGHLEKRKGVDLMLRAVQLFQDRKPALKFNTHIIGGGSQEAELRSLVTDHRIRNVYFWGFKQKTEIAEFLGISDLLIFPSVSELYGLVPIEAMACGMPVLASSFAGVTVDLIKDGVNGFTIDPYNTIDLCARMEQLIEDSDLRHRIGTEAGKTIMENFMISHSVRGFVDAVRYSRKIMSGQPS